MAVLLDAERRVANTIAQRYGSIGKALEVFDRNKNGVVCVPMLLHDHMFTM